MGNRFLFCRVVILAIMSGLCAPPMLKAGEVTVAWDPIIDPELAGYTVVWGQAPKVYTGSQDVSTVTEAKVSLESGKTYFLAVRGYDKQESRRALGRGHRYCECARHSAACDFGCLGSQSHLFFCCDRVQYQ